jgi:hypothetical protein
MDAASSLEVIEQLFFSDRRQAMEKLSDFVESAEGKNAAAALREIVKRVDHEHPGLAAYLALAGGAIIEQGEDASALGRALVAPLERSLVAAGRMLDHVAHLPDAPTDEDEDDGHDHDHDHDDGDGHDHDHDHGDGHDHDHDHHHEEEHVMIGSKAVTREILDGIAEKDLVAVQAWFSMDIWYRPAVATWTRDPAVLREAQRSQTLHAALDKLGSATETSHWLSLLVETVFDARFVVLFPELGEAWQLTADGVVDMGQLSALMSPELRDPLARIGITDGPDEETLAVMRGEGPQQGDGTYSCGFHCYPIEATDPATAIPRDGVHTWRAPGGTGTHSLPPDFLPGSLALVDGARVLTIVGPRSEGMRFVRSMPAVRTFDELHARVVGATKLSATDAARWFETAKRHAA